MTGFESLEVPHSFVFTSVISRKGCTPNKNVTLGFFVALLCAVLIQESRHRIFNHTIRC